jgi:hypothetical protein
VLLIIQILFQVDIKLNVIESFVIGIIQPYKKYKEGVLLTSCHIFFLFL